MRTAKHKRLKSALAVILSLTLAAAASGCKKTSEGEGDIPSLDDVTVSTAATDDIEVTTAPPTETTTEPTTTTTETETEPEETTAPTETTPAESSETEETTTQQQTWSETAMSATMYVTENCYSRERAIVGSTPISQHYRGDSVEIIAITDTEYYKLAEGGFIHSDYLSDTMPQTTAAPVQTTVAEEATDSQEFISNDGNSTWSGGVLADSSYNIKSSSRYAYKQLNSNEQTLYNRIVTAVQKLDNAVEIPSGMTSDDVIKVYSIVYNSEPQLFWMGSSIKAGMTFATISYKTNDKAEIQSMQKEINAAASKIISKANNYSGTVSKLKVIYDTIVLGSDFSKSTDGYNSSIYNGLTGKGELQCAGYAKSMQYLCDLAGIDCMVVTGTDKNGNSHAWNVVYCENGYYNIDATWGDPINSFDSNYIQYEFFLVPDAWIHNITHYNINSMTRSTGTTIHLFDPPACTKEACNYFAAYSKLYDSKESAETALYAAFDDAVANKRNVAEVRVTSKEIYDTLMTDDAFRAFQKTLKGKYSNVKRLQRQSSFTGGVYVVHYDIEYTE